MYIIYTCSLQKKGLSDVFAMAKVGKAVWKEFQEVNLLHKKGSLKDQKVSAGEVMQEFVNLKQWHMKPLCSLNDEQRLYLLTKVKCKSPVAYFEYLYLQYYCPNVILLVTKVQSIHTVSIIFRQENTSARLILKQNTGTVFITLWLTF